MKKSSLTFSPWWRRIPGKVIRPATYRFSEIEQKFFDINLIRRHEAVVIVDLSSRRQIEPPEVKGLATQFAALKTLEDIDHFARSYGLLGVAKTGWGGKPTYGTTMFEPIEIWQHHIGVVRCFMLNYRRLARRKKGYDSDLLPELLTSATMFAYVPEEEATEEQITFTSLATVLKHSLSGGIGVEFSRIVPAKDSPLGYRIAEQYTTEFLLAAIYYDLWELITEHRPVIRCRQCGLPLEKTGRREYCNNACKQAAYRRRKQKAANENPQK